MKKKSFIRRVLFFFIAACMAPSLLFIGFFIQQTRLIEEKQMDKSLSALATEKAQAVKKDLKAIENESVNLALWSGDCLNMPSDGRPLSKEYIRNANHVLERTSADSQDKSNIYLPAGMELTNGIADEIKKSEKLDRVMKSIEGQNKDITYAYVIFNSGLMRVYPYLSNDAYASNHDQRSDYFYTSAVQESDPSGQAVWTNPYWDYAGNGWIITCSCPFYEDGRLEGVACLDVSLSTLAESVADFSISGSGFVFIIAENGDVIYHPQMMKEIRSTGERFQMNLITDPRNSKEYRQIIRAMTKEKTGRSSYQDEQGKERIISFTTVDGLNWKLGIEVNQSDYMQGFHYLSKRFSILLFGLLAVCIAVGIMLTMKITRPIRELTLDVQNMKSGQFGTVHVGGRDEIGMLAEAFNQMSREIGQYAESLLYRTNQLETVFHSIGGVLMILGTDCRIRMINREGAEQNEDHTPSDNSRFDSLIGSFCYQALYNGDTPCGDCPIERVIQEKCPKNTEQTHRQNVYELCIYPVLDENEQVAELVVYRRCITEQVMMEHELYQSEKMADVGQMVAGITHELKNPLAVIKGAVYLLRRVSLNEEKKAHTLEEIESSVVRAEKMIYNMLDFSRMSEGEESYSVRTLLERIFLLVRQELVKKRISFSIKLEGEEKERPLLLYGNGDSFQHIFLNLISNAIDAMDGGGHLRITGRTLEGGTVTELLFCNDGRVIPKEDFHRIFEPFFTTKEHGTGLGLWIVSRELARNRGTIEVLGGAETCMKIKLPAVRRAAEGEKNHEKTNFDD